MSFLEIDGLTIPVATSSPRLSFDEIGGFARAVSGAGILSRQAVKRAWEIETTPMSEAMATAMESILLAKGYLWKFRGDSYASNGFVPDTITDNDYATGRVATAPQYKISEVRFNHVDDEQDLVLDVPTTNELTQNQSTFDTGVTGATAIDSATLSRETAFDMDGDGCLKVVTSGTVNATQGGVELAATITSSTKLAGSVYVLAETAVQIEAVLALDAVTVSETITLEPYVWTRVCLGIWSAAGTAASIKILEAVADSNITFYVDHAQLERDRAMPTAWITGGTARSTTGRLLLASSGLASIDGPWSLAFWFLSPGKLNATAGASHVYLARLVITGGTYIWVYLQEQGTLTYWVWVVIGDGGLPVQQFIIGSISSSSTGWHHLALTAQRDDDGGTEIELYIDGASVDTETIDRAYAPFLTLSEFDNVDFGSDGASSVFSRSLSQLLIIPTILPASLVSMLYNSGDGCVFGAWPKHRVSGGILHGQAAIEAYVQLAQGSPVDFCDADGVWQAGRTVRFRLLEA